MVDRAYINLGTAALEGYDTGRLRRARQEAKASYGAGDLDGARRTLLPYDPEGARGYAQEIAYGRADDAYLRSERDRVKAETYNTRAANAYLQDDYDGAARAAAEYGDPAAVAAARNAGVERQQSVLAQQRDAKWRREADQTMSSLQQIRNIASLPPDQQQPAWEDYKAQAARDIENDDDRQAFAQIAQMGWSADLGSALLEGLEMNALRYQDPKNFAAMMAKRRDDEIARQRADWQQRYQQMQADTAERRASAAETTAAAAMARANKTDDSVTAQRIFSRAGSLRDDFRGDAVAKSFGEIKSVYDRSKAYLARAESAGRGFPMGDIGLVFALAKINDPTSVVRETEFEQIAKSGGFGDSIKNFVAQARGRGFDSNTRRQLVQEIESAYNTAQSNYSAKQAQFASLAERAGVDPTDVMPDYAGTPTRPPNVPPGFIWNGSVWVMP